MLTVPPLRARREDVPLLAEHFGRAMAHELGWRDFPGFAADALQALLAQPWPGNVRELKNVVERAVYRAPRADRAIAAVQFDPFDSPLAAGAAPQRRGGHARPRARPGRSTRRAAGHPVPRDFRAATTAYERALLERALSAQPASPAGDRGRSRLSYDQCATSCASTSCCPATLHPRRR